MPKDIQNPSGKLSNRAAKQEIRRQGRAAIGTKLAEAAADVISRPNVEQAGQQVGIAGKAGRIVEDAELSTPRVREEDVPVDR